MATIDENANLKLYENFQQMAKEFAGVQDKQIEELEKTEGEDEILTGENVTLEEGEQQQTREKGRVNRLHNPALNATDNFDLAEKICDKLHAANANLKNSFDSGDVKKYTGAVHAMLKAAGVNITSTTKVFFNIFSLMELMLETAQQQRTAGREMRNAELLATTTSIERQADKQVEAAVERRNASMVSAGFSIGMGAVSVATSAFGAASAVAASAAESSAGKLSDMAQEVLDAANDVSDLSKNVNSLSKDVSDLTKNVSDLTKNVSNLSQKGAPQFIDETVVGGNKMLTEGQKKLTENLDKVDAGVKPPATQPEIKVKLQETEVKNEVQKPEIKVKVQEPEVKDEVQKPEIKVKVQEPEVNGGKGTGEVDKPNPVHPKKLANDLSNDPEFLDAKNTVEGWRLGGKGKPPEEVVKAAHKLKQASIILTKQSKNSFTTQTTLKGLTEGLAGVTKGMGDILAASMNMKAEMIQAEATREQVNQKFAEAAMQDATEAMQTAQEVINTVIRAMLQVLTSQVEMMKQLHFA